MWHAYKTVNNIVADVLCNRRDDRILEFEICLEKYKDVFMTPMCNVPRSATDRQLTKKSDIEAISISGIPQKILLTHDMSEEACALSDLFDLNELVAVELLLSAEAQLPSYPGLTRGSVAVTLYYDAHRSFAEALRTIIQSRNGRMWSLNMSQEASQLIDAFTNELFEGGIVANILAFLSKLNVQEELVRLDSVRALGGSQHRRDISRLLVGICNCFAECILLWAVQTPLNFASIKLVHDHLVKILTPQQAPSTASEEERTLQSIQPLDHVSAHLIVALLYSFEPFALPGIEVDQLADADKEDLKHPIFTESGYINAVTTLLSDQQQSDNATEGFLALLQLAWGVCLRRVSHIRMDIRRQQRDVKTESPGISVVDEDIIATALESNAIEFLSAALVIETDFCRETLWVQRVHNLVTDLLVQFPQNVRDIRLHDEVIIRRTGSDPSAHGTGFAALIGLISRLYNVPGSPLHARLSLEYWWPAGETRAPSTPPTGGVSFMPLSTSFRAGECENSRQAVLFRFVYSASEFAAAPSLFVPYVTMLRSLVGCQSSASLCFNLLKANASSGGRLASILTWDHFITSLQKYLENLKRVPPSVLMNNPHDRGVLLHLQHPHLYQATSYEQSQLGLPSVQSQSTQQLEIQPEELEALRAVVGLISRVCMMDPIARSLFATSQKWRLVPVIIGLITCPLSMGMKADLLHLLSSLSRCRALGNDVWRTLCDNKLLSFVDSSQSIKNIAGLHTEMDKVEARAEEYPITQAFITLLTIIAPSVSESSSKMPPPATGDSADIFSKVVNFVMETIFLKHTMRAYRRPNERWEIAASCIALFEGLVRTFIQRMNSVAVLLSGGQSSDAQLANLDWSALLSNQGGYGKFDAGGFHQAGAKLHLPQGWPFSDPGYQIVVQLLTNSSLFSLLTGLLEVGLYRLLEYSTTTSLCAMIRTTIGILRLFEQILPHEQILVNLVRRAALAVPHLRSGSGWTTKSRSTCDVILPMQLSRLLVVTVNSRTGRADLLVTIIRYCSLSEDLPDHCASALNILCSVARAVQPHTAVLAVFTNDKKSEQELLHALVSCLTRPETPESIADLESDGLDVVTGMPAFTDAWLYGQSTSDGSLSDLTALGVASGATPHPATRTARLWAAFPTMPPEWFEPGWDTLAAFPHTGTDSNTLINDDLWFNHFIAPGGVTKIRTRMLHLILSTLSSHPTPSLAHWLLGFRSKDARNVLMTTLQDAGVGGFPRTCLHAILDVIEGAVTMARNANDLNPDMYSLCLALQWDAAVAWQILYHLAASATTATPICRYLRGNHDLIARHCTTGLITARLSFEQQVQTGGESTGAILHALILNQWSWLLKMTAIELQSSTSQRTYLARLLNNLFANQNDHNEDTFNIGASTMDRFAFLPSFSPSPQTPQARLLVDLLSQMQPADLMQGPAWVFDRDSEDSKLVEQLVMSCEEVCRLVSTNDQCALGSNLVNSSALISRLNILLAITKPSFSDVGCPTARADEASLLVADITRWAHKRNAHRLCLVAGKQAFLEGWRQVAEMGMRILQFMLRVAPETLVAGNSSSFINTAKLNPTRSSGFAPLLMGDGAAPASNQYLYQSAMALLLPLLQQVAAPETTPTVLKVLASGTCLTISAFLQLLVSSTPGSETTVCASQRSFSITAQGLLAAIQCLAQAILSAKSALQRVRANYYGAVCYILDICQQLNNQSLQHQQITDVSICLKAVNILVGEEGIEAGADSWSHREGRRKSFLVTLFGDVSSGHHPIIPISAMGLLTLLLKLDFSSGQVLETVIRDGCMQFTIDSLEDDLTHLQQHLLHDEGFMGNQPSTSLVDATAAFYVYQSKMSLLSLVASMPLGAKMLVQTQILDILTRFELYTGSCLADALTTSLSEPLSASVAVHEDSKSPTTEDVAWLDSYEYSRFLGLVRNYASGCDSLAPDCNLLAHDSVVCSRLLVNPANADLVGSAPVDATSLTWSGILMPALALTKSILFTLGSAHVSAVQKASRFIYTHADALLTTTSSCNAVAIIAALAMSSTSEDLPAQQVLMRSQYRAMLSWLQGEESLMHTLAFIMRARTPTSLGEPDDLPRELLRSKSLRHVFSFLPGLLQALQSRDQRSFTVSSSTRATFERCFLVTKQIEVLRLVTNTCVSAVSIEDEFGHFESTSLKNLIFSPSINSAAPERDVMGEPTAVSTASSGRPNLGLVLQLLSWSVGRLHHLESIVSSASRHLPSVSSATSTTSAAHLPGSPSTNSSSIGDPSEAKPVVVEKRDHQPMDKILHTIIQLSISQTYDEDISTDSLRQIASTLFSVRSFASSHLLQTNGVFGIDVGQRNAYFRRFIAVGGALLQTQLSCLIDIMEQSLYLLWRHLSCYLNKQSFLAMNSVGGDGPSIKPDFSENALLSSHRFTETVAQSPLHKDRMKMAEADLLGLATALPRRLNFDLFDSILQIAKAPYISSSDKLFVEVMVQKLDRVNQMALKITNESKR